MKLIAFSEAACGRALYVPRESSSRQRRQKGPDCLALTKTTLLAMKLMTVFLLAGSLGLSARGLTQTITLSLRNVPLEQVFHAIEKQSEYRFVYSREDIQKVAPVTIQLSNARLEDALNQCFKDQPLGYTLVDKLIVVKGKALKKLQDAVEPPIDVKGRVVNERGEPVEGVTVTIKGTNKIAYTDKNGEFSLSSVDKEALLVFTSVNMETFEVKVKDREELSVRLKTKVSALGDVTVTVNTGYQILPKERATGSFTLVNKEQLDVRVAPDIISKLEGITNGLVFNKDPNSRTNKLRVRGESTIFANANPLIVVDNFPYDGDINNINPNDVENITILKDAAAASIWGVQAGNGVIVITTRRAKLNQQLRLELNTNITVSDRPDLFYAPAISPSDYIDFEQFLFTKGYYTSALADINKKAVSPVVEILAKQASGNLTSTDAAAQINALRNQDLRADLDRYVYQKAVQQQYQLNISGGSNKANYYFSTGYDKGLSSVIGINNNRITVNNQNIFSLIKGLEIRTGIVYTEATVTNNGITSIPNVYPYMQLADKSGSELSIPQHRAVFEDTISNRGFPNWKYYPLQERSSTNNKSKTYDTKLTAGIKYSFFKGLSFEVSYQYNRSVVQTRNYISAQSYFIRNLMNTFSIISNGNYTGSNYPNGGDLTVSTSDLTGHYGRSSLGYNYSSREHSFAAIAGFEVRQVSTQSNNSHLYGYNDENGTFSIPNAFVQYAQYPSGSMSYLVDQSYGLAYSGTLNRFKSYFGNSSYTYKNRYTISLSGRLDGSNYFGVKTNQKTIPLWSVGGKWDISKETFYNGRSIPVLSIRLTYGYNGNLAQNLAAITTFQYQGNASYTGLPYAGINNIPNPELRWEKTAQYNLGIDFSTKNRRLYGSLEFYRKIGNDLIGDAPIDPTTGITQIRGNFSGMRSNGVDVQLISKNIDKTIKWNTGLIFNYSSEKVTRYNISLGQGIVYFNSYKQLLPVVDYPVYSLFSYKWAGLDPSNGAPRIYLGDTINQSYTTATTNAVKLADLKYNGRYNPIVAGSISNTFAIKGIGISFNVTYKFGYYFRRTSIDYNAMGGNWQNGHRDYSMRWQRPGDENYTNVPSLLYPFVSIRDDFYTKSDILVEKGDHIRLQFVNLSYNLEDKLLKRTPFLNMQLYCYINNLGILWRANKEGIDPDYPYLNYPNPRTYSIGLKAIF